MQLHYVTSDPLNPNLPDCHRDTESQCFPIKLAVTDSGTLTNETGSVIEPKAATVLCHQMLMWCTMKPWRAA